MSATVSVIIPTYNRVSWVEGTVRSALNQSLPPAEIIVVDDGSSDDTSGVAGRLPSPVRYIRQENAGVAAARNTGAAVASGEYLAFLDCEDLWEPRMLETHLAVLAARPEVGWSLSDCVVVDLENQPVQGRQGWQRVFPLFGPRGVDPEAFFSCGLEQATIDAPGGAVPVFAGDAFRLLFAGNFGLPSATVVRRSLFEQIGGFDSGWRMAEETEFYHRLSAAAAVAVVMRPLVRYRVGQAGALTGPRNTLTLIGNALESLDRARLLRPATPDLDDAWLAGRRRLLEEQAYASLANWDPAAARAALRELGATGGLSDRARMLRLVALLPPFGLRVLHRLKRLVT